MKTAGYHNVNVRNFTTSWRDGLAFNAIIHKHRSDLIHFDKLTKNNAIQNLNNAFNVAEDKLGLTKLLDAEDVFVEHPDEKSIITYVVTYYHYFSKMKQETVQGKRIGKVVGIAMDNDRMVNEYESLTSDLLRYKFNLRLIKYINLYLNSFLIYQMDRNNNRAVGRPPVCQLPCRSSIAAGTVCQLSYCWKTTQVCWEGQLGGAAIHPAV